MLQAELATRIWAVVLLAGASGCLVEYTIGGAGTSSAESGTCPEGPSCGSGCGSTDACDECPAGQIKCGERCVEPNACDADEGCLVGQVMCDNACVPADSCPCEYGCDAVGELCVGGACRCRDGLVRCGGDCVDIGSDAQHCGECNEPCADELVCDLGACAAACGPSRVVCDGACVDLESHPLHCDDCAKSCPADQLCIAGGCEPYDPIEGCAACPCSDVCEESDTEVGGNCCDSPFLGGPVCVEIECD